VTIGLVLAVWLPLLLWFLAFTPGIMTTDSLDIYHQAISGPARWMDWHPPLNTAAMWLSVEVTGGPGLVTLGQSLLLAAGIVAVARAAVRAGANRRAVIAVTAVVALSPMVGGFAVSVWKDVPFTACLLFVGAAVIDLTRALARDDERGRTGALRAIVLWGLGAAVVRQNGLLFLALLLAALFVLFPSLRRPALIGFLVAAGTVGALKLLVYPAFGIKPTSPNFSLASFSHDFGSVVVRDPAFFDPDERALLNRIAPLDAWRAGYRESGCSSINWQFGPQFDWRPLVGEEGSYVGSWLRLLVENPRMVLGNRLCMAAIAWRPDPVGPQYTVGRTTDPNRWGMRLSPASGTLHRAGVAALDFTDRPAIQWLLWRAPIWIYVAYVAFGVTALRRRRWLHLLPLLPIAVQQVTIVLAVLGQDARFMMPALILAVLVLPLSVARYATPEPSEAAADAVQAS
jgi:hypothetical protein